MSATESSGRAPPRLLTVVVPIYNDGACIAELTKQLSSALEAKVTAWELLVVDDGSTDGSFQVVRALAAADPRIRALRLSRNWGHQAALTCGLDHADGDVVVTMDSDLEHPPALVPSMIEHWRRGFDVVSMRKTAQEGRGLLKTLLASMFYWLFNALSDVKITPGGSDFRLLDRKCVLAVRATRTQRPFLRGLVRWIGFSRIDLPYATGTRVTGRPQYTLRKLAALASAGWVSFATSPLRLGLWLGVLVLLLATALWLLGLAAPELGTRPLALGALPPLLAVGGLALLCIGIVGAYVAVLLDEVRARPIYLVSDSIGIEPRPPKS